MAAAKCYALRIRNIFYVDAATAGQRSMQSKGRAGAMHTKRVSTTDKETDKRVSEIGRDRLGRYLHTITHITHTPRHCARS